MLEILTSLSVDVLSALGIPCLTAEIPKNQPCGLLLQAYKIFQISPSKAFVNPAVEHHLGN